MPRGSVPGSWPTTCTSRVQTVDRWMRGGLRPDRTIAVRWEELCGAAAGSLVGPYDNLPLAPGPLWEPRSALAITAQPSPLAFLLPLRLPDDTTDPLMYGRPRPCSGKSIPTAANPS
jgi:hypothetical protein